MNAALNAAGLRLVAPGALVRLPAGAGGAPRLGIVAEIRNPDPTVWVFPYDEQGRLLVDADGSPRAAAYVLGELEPVEPDRRAGGREPAAGMLRWRAGPNCFGVGELRDVSLDGLGFVAAEPPPAGTTVAIEIPTLRGGPAAVECVVRTVVAAPDGGFRVGCQFVRRVAPADLAALLP